eukprot:TRINITY_DN4945_c0_g1_i1.p1 TRINITY_DN4945_c0_g1~~TRINITY_DN4945_c0_g1_i1.p1  ORF type:complete len:465 (-),score=104.22 TRINITY_DN4945_c0_g1_i1:102-1496(-)
MRALTPLLLLLACARGSSAFATQAASRQHPSAHAVAHPLLHAKKHRQQRRQSAGSVRAGDSAGAGAVPDNVAAGGSSHSRSSNGRSSSRSSSSDGARQVAAPPRRGGAGFVASFRERLEAIFLCRDSAAAALRLHLGLAAAGIVVLFAALLAAGLHLLQALWSLALHGGRQAEAEAGRTPTSAAAGELCPELYVPPGSGRRLLVPCAERLGDRPLIICEASSGRPFLRVAPRGPVACRSPQARHALASYAIGAIGGVLRVPFGTSTPAVPVTDMSGSSSPASPIDASPGGRSQGIWRLLLTYASGRDGVLAQCCAIGQRDAAEFHVLRADGSYFAKMLPLSHERSREREGRQRASASTTCQLPIARARVNGAERNSRCLAEDGSQQRLPHEYVALTGAGRKYFFCGDGWRHELIVSDSDGEMVACTDVVDSGSYSLLVGAGVDMALVLCCLLCIDWHLQDIYAC